MSKKEILDDLVRLLPYWHYKVERPIKQSQKHSSISYEAYYCLIALLRNGAMSMSELSSSLKLSKQQATQIIDKLYQHHLVERASDEKDRRIIRIVIRDEGKAFLLENEIDTTKLLEQISLNLSEEDILRLKSATTIFLDILPKLK